MNKNKTISGKKDLAYTELVKLIKNEIELGRRVIEHQKALRYWNVGGHIWDYQLRNRERAPYGERLFFWLSQDLDINDRTLQQTVRFHREFPIPKPASQLAWTHYCLLLTVKDQQDRKRWKERVIREDLNSKELRSQIREYNKREEDKIRSQDSQSTQPPAKLEVRRGKLWTCKVLEPKTIQASEGTVVLDCGFDVWREVSCGSDELFQEGDIVRATENRGGGAPTPIAPILKKAIGVGAAQELFIYQVALEKVIDGDTLWVVINCLPNLKIKFGKTSPASSPEVAGEAGGFGTWTRQKLRLNGIDCPELPTPEGLRAKQFVQDRLTKALCIIIKTYKNDKYDRYLSDIFYLPPNLRQAGSQDTTDPERTAAEGIFLNQELLDAGLATVWKE